MFVYSFLALCSWASFEFPRNENQALQIPYISWTSGSAMAAGTIASWGWRSVARTVSSLKCPLFRVLCGRAGRLKQEQSKCLSPHLFSLLWSWLPRELFNWVTIVFLTGTYKGGHISKAGLHGQPSADWLSKGRCLTSLTLSINTNKIWGQPL